MIHVQVFFNRFVLLQDGREICRCDAPFSNQRIIIADFDCAVQALKTLYAEYRKRMAQGVFGFLAGAPVVCMDVKADLLGGLSPVENKVVRECALAMGARKVDVVYSGK